eukprot:5281356-Amphidinium_carterae.1
MDDPDRLTKELRMENFRNVRLDVLQRSLAMLADILDPLLPEIVELFDADFWARLIGQFEQSNQSLQIPHPWSWRIAESLQSTPRTSEEVKALKRVVEEVRKIAHKVEEDSSEEETHYPWKAS